MLVPLTGRRNISNTIESVFNQKFHRCEILILRNGISDIPGKAEVYEDENWISRDDVTIREILICKKGKGNALNIGAERSRYGILCMVDADSILERNAFETATANFENKDIIAVGGRLVAVNEKKNLLTLLQRSEYERTFNISRVILNSLNANCLISGAYGMFRKNIFLKTGGYDGDTVAEDMEIILRLQYELYCTGKRIVYDHKSVCYTETPSTFSRYLRQRDRWQRGLMDSLVNHPQTKDLWASHEV